MGLVTVEGIDGSGKSTLAAALAEHLGATLLREPGGVAASERIRTLVKETGVDARAEALLFAAARAQLVSERLQPLLDGGSTVVLDRFVDSTLAYQGARGLDLDELRALNDFATGGLTADRTLYLRIDPAAALERCGDRGDTDRFEDLGYLHRVASIYDELATASHWRTVEASAPPESVLAAALQAL